MLLPPLVAVPVFLAALGGRGKLFSLRYRVMSPIFLSRALISAACLACLSAAFFLASS